MVLRYRQTLEMTHPTRLADVGQRDNAVLGQLF